MSSKKLWHVKRVVRAEDLIPALRIADAAVVKILKDCFEIYLVFKDTDSKPGSSETGDGSLRIDLEPEEAIRDGSILEIVFGPGNGVGDSREKTGKSTGASSAPKEEGEDDRESSMPEKQGGKDEERLKTGSEDRRDRKQKQKKAKRKGKRKWKVDDEKSWVVDGDHAYLIRDGIVEARYKNQARLKLPFDTVKEIYDELPAEATTTDLIEAASRQGVKLSRLQATALARVFSNMVFDAEIIGGGRGHPLLILKQGGVSNRDEIRRKLELEREIIGGYDDHE